MGQGDWEDGSLMPRAYGAWKQNAKNSAARILQAHAPADMVEKVCIQLVEFQAWCEANSLGVMFLKN